MNPSGGMALAEKTLKPQTVEPKMSREGKITLGVGVGVLVAGYMFLATGSMTLAPLLIIGGLVTIGVGIYNL
jgi:hypothetical protein